MSKNLINSSNTLRLSPSTPLAALGHKAEAAALSAAARRIASSVRQCAVGRGRQAPEREPMIDRTVRMIQRHLEATVGSTRLLVNERPGRYASVHTILCVYCTADIERYKAEMAAWKASGRIGRKPSAPKAETRYMFFASVIDPDKLGSVAVSGDALEQHRQDIIRSGSLFGLAVRGLSLQSGRHDYIDVKFRA